MLTKRKPIYTDHMKIIVAEDCKATTMLLKQLLQKLGHCCFCAANGKEAQQVIISNAKHYDLIITDIRMPGMDGIELAHYVRQNVNDQIKIIGMSADEPHTGWNRVFDHWLRKPVSAESLCRALDLVGDKNYAGKDTRVIDLNSSPDAETKVHHKTAD